MVKNIFFCALIVAASGYLSPPAALLLGLIYGFTFTHPYAPDSRKLAKFLLQVSVVGLGFGMNLDEVLRAGRSGFLYTAISIAVALALGWLIGHVLRVERTSSFLISAGTAICGGSAIAALAPIVNASEEEMGISLGTIFVLNSIALFVFPLIGAAMHLTETQFGLWSALAIHDTSSVVGATAKYGALALAVGTTVKLTRALWIVPVSIATSVARKRGSRSDQNGRPNQNDSLNQNDPINLPWFIGFFCLAAVAKTYLHAFNALYPKLNHLGVIGLTVTLFLIGAGISRKTLREVGPRPMLQGILLWVVVATSSLLAIWKGWISL